MHMEMTTKCRWEAPLELRSYEISFLNQQEKMIAKF